MRRLAAWLWLGALAAQEPPVDPAVVEAGEALLRAHAERSRGVRVMVAAYEQIRTTPLAKEPLRSRGSFLFVRDPACIVFRATAPRESIVRLRGSLYEVFRPQQKRLERFHLEGPELAQGLFAAVGGDAAALLAGFAVAACGPDPDDAGRTLVTMKPRTEAMRERVPELRLLYRKSDGGLQAVAYRDRGGDLVEIVLRDVVADPEQPPSTEFDVPEGTTVVEHAPPKQRG